MRLKLKKISKDKLINIPNLYYFLGALIIIGISIGIIFYLKINLDDKILVKDNIDNYFNYINNSDHFDFISSFKTSLINNLTIIVCTWILGISIIGIPLILFILFMKSFALGFTWSTIIAKYQLKGIIGILAYSIPDKICLLILLFFLTISALIFSYKIIMFIFFKKDYNLNYVAKKYLKILGLALLLGIVISILETFVSPFIIKAFTFIIN